MMQSISGRTKLGKSLLGAGLTAFCTLLVACSGSGSSSSTDGATLGSTFLPAETQSGVVPQITAVSPSTLFPGEILTLTGTGFGASQLDTSRVRFSGDGTNLNLDAGSVPLTTDWTDTRIRIAVPTAAVTGPVQIVLNNRTASEQVSNAPRINVKRAFDPTATPKLIFVNPSQGQFVGADAPVTIIFDRPVLFDTPPVGLLPGTLNVTSVSLVSVSAPNPSPNPATDTQPAENPCRRPIVCDLRTTDLIGCNCTFQVAVTKIEDVSASLRAVPQTAFRVSHASFGVYSFQDNFISIRTVVLSINATIRADGSKNADGTTRAVPGADIPSTGEFRFFFVN